MTTPVQPVEFVSRNGNDQQRVGNEVVLAAGAAVIGAVTVNNAAGAAAVNVQDGGNTLTVDGTVTVQDGGNTITVDGTVILGAGEAHAGEVGAPMNVNTPVEIIRPTDGPIAYAIGDRVGETGAVTAPKELTGMARINAGSGYIVGIRIATDKKSIVPRLRVHFFNASNPTLAADNALYTELYADAGKRVFYYDMPAMTTAPGTAGSDCSRTQDFSMRIPFKCAAGTTSLWFAFETLDAFTPADAEKFNIVVKVEQN